MPEREPIRIVGAGPVGLALALGLARHGTPCRVFDRDAGPCAISRATEVHARTLEVLDLMGVAADFVDRGLVMREVTNAHSPAIQMALIESGIRSDSYAAQRPEQSISSSRPVRPQYSLAILRS